MYSSSVSICGTKVIEYRSVFFVIKKTKKKTTFTWITKYFRDTLYSSAFLTRNPYKDSKQ